MYISILLADPYPMVRSGLSKILSPEEDLVIVGEADDAPQTVSRAQHSHPDVILCESKMPSGKVTNIANSLRAGGLSSKIIVLSSDCSGESVSEAVSEGVAGYLSKHEPVERLPGAIRRVHAGHPVFSEEAQSGMQFYLQFKQKQTGCDAQQFMARPLLTERELEVLKCIAEGLSSEEIGRHLHTSVSTVKNQRQSIFVKLNVPNAPGAVYEAMIRGLLK